MDPTLPGLLSSQATVRVTKEIWQNAQITHISCESAASVASGHGVLASNTKSPEMAQPSVGPNFLRSKSSWSLLSRPLART
ncbi:hypothetical protein PAL_GLEAN10000499 [Pteropus alecto]|uniref:Uncharacterized protein n=1 Tax=Pteropus alecto TaxID=9402 RepID=L5L487_PTEAL|nr:hypothetical protein PAL_GLEAN10000499 [Pteropus alecto]